MGPARAVTTDLARLSGADTFVETGTFKGKTTRWAAQHFHQVHTVERAKVFFDRYSPELSQSGNIQTHLGDSRAVLPNIITLIGDSAAIFWLDGHWCGGQTAGETDECPLIQELELLRDRPQDIIMIDDARLFLSAPPTPHDPDDWPTLFDIASVFRHRLDQVFIQIFHDIIMIVPNNPELVDSLRSHARLHAEQLLKT